jgi:hypothetical protein
MLWPKGIELFTEDQAFPLSYDLAPTLVPHSISLPLSFCLSPFELIEARGVEEVVEEPNHKTAKKKPSPL